MSADPNKKSARSFQCRDVLWETFEQMARELECSVDYLINEAMKQYARQRSYGGSRTPYPSPQRGGGEAQPPSDPRGGFAGTAPPGPVAPLPPPARPPGGSLPAPPTGGRGLPPPGRPAPLPAPPPRGASGLPAPPQARAAPAMQMPQVPRSVPPPAPGRSMPPPLPRPPTPLPAQAQQASNGFPSPAGHAATLSLIYQGERVAVTKDRFVIGRGKQSSDLTLKDPNVSRQHAMIEFQNGVYFMVDMGSTNGVEFNGQRIARKQISEGDVYRICDHDILFTYR
ncbi:MAG: FHA domain-containing protein [Polyangiaceae bacterium]